MNDYCRCPPRADSPRSKKVWLGLAVFWAGGFVLWPGCATPPLLPSRTPAGPLQTTDVKAARKALTQKQVAAQLGEPDVFVEDIRVACYRLNHVSRHRLVLLLGMIPLGTAKDNLGLEVAMFQYDAQGNVLRQDRRTVRKPFDGILMNMPGPQVKGGGNPVPPDYFDVMVRSEALHWVSGHPGKI